VIDDARFRSLVEQTNALIFVLDREGAFTYVNEAAEPILGFAPSAIIGRSAFDFLTPESLADAAGAFLDLFGRSGPTVAWESPPLLLQFHHANGTLVALEVVAMADDQTGETSGVALRSEYQYATEQFAEGLARFGATADLLQIVVDLLRGETNHSHSAVSWEWQDDHFQRTVGDIPPLLAGCADGARPALDGPWTQALATGEPVFAEASDLSPRLREVAAERGLGSCWAQPIDRNFAGAGACIIVWRAEDTFRVYMHGVMLRRAAALTSLAFERGAHQAALDHASTHDPLTGVGNREHYFSTLGERVTNVTFGTTVLNLDIDRLREVNETFGHRAGDLVLTHLARRLRDVLDPGDQVFRLGDDTFAVVCHERIPADRLEPFVGRIRTAISQRLTIAADEAVAIVASVGIASTYSGGADADALAHEAARALVEAKAAGGDTWRLSLT